MSLKTEFSISAQRGLVRISEFTQGQYLPSQAVFPKLFNYASNVQNFPTTNPWMHIY